MARGAGTRGAAGRQHLSISSHAQHELANSGKRGAVLGLDSVGRTVTNRTYPRKSAGETSTALQQTKTSLQTLRPWRN